MANDYIVHKAIELSNLSARAVAAITDERWVISPKYDGCHAVFAFDDGRFIGAYSRTGESVKSMDHIGRSLPDLYGVSKGRVAICGEAWMVGTEFNEISGAFRRQSPQPQLQFVPFDIVPFDYNTDTTSGPPILLGQLDSRPYSARYEARIASLVAQRKNVISQVLRPRYYVAIGKLEDAYRDATNYAKQHKARKDSFFDGAVLARASGRYEVGSGKGGEFIKCKPLLSLSVKVTAVIADIGSKTGKNTCVLCFDLDGEIQKVSTGLTQAQVDAYVNDPYQIIDATIEVEAMGYTVNGLLREPRFKGIRTDA